MPGSPHPIDVLLQDDAAVDKAAWRADVRLGQRRTVEDAQEIRDTDFTGQFGGIFVRSLSDHFKLDTGSVAADDGTTVIIDAAGNHFLVNGFAIWGTGAPTFTAAQGTIYLRTDGSGTNDRAYINTDGGTTWTPLTTAA